MTKFNPDVGDIVLLLSGGNLMTVVERKFDSVRCTWHGENGTPYETTYPIVAIRSAEGMGLVLTGAAFVNVPRRGH